MLNLSALIQILLLSACTTNAYPVKARFLRDPGEKFGVKYELPKPFIAKVLLDSKSSLLSSEETTFDDSPDTEEQFQLPESYSFDPRDFQRLDVNAAEENFEDYSGSTITLPNSSDVDYDNDLAFPDKRFAGVLLRKTRSDEYDSDHMNMENEEMSPTAETENPPTSTDPTVNVGGGEITEMVTDTTSETLQDNTTPQDGTDSTLTTNTENPVSTDVRNSEETTLEYSTVSDSNTDSTTSQEYSTTVQQGDESTGSTESPQETTTTIEYYTIPLFDLADFLARLDKPPDRVSEGLISMPFFSFDY